MRVCEGVQGRVEINIETILDMEKDRPDRPIVQPIVIAWIIEDDRYSDS
jgi:hypothetical protein